MVTSDLQSRSYKLHSMIKALHTMSHIQRESKTNERPFVDSAASPSSQNVDIEPPVVRKMNNLEAWVRALSGKNGGSSLKDVQDVPIVLDSPPSPKPQSAQLVEDKVGEDKIRCDSPPSNTPITVVQSKEDCSPCQHLFDPGEDSDWELEWDSTTAGGYESDADSDGIIDENGVGIIWHAGHHDSPTDMANNNADSGKSDFLHVDVFSAEMYFRAMSLRAASAYHKSYSFPNSD